jgi:hypothetical protein
MQELTHKKIEQVNGGDFPFSGLIVPALLTMAPYLALARHPTFQGLAISGAVGAVIVVPNMINEYAISLIIIGY